MSSLRALEREATLAGFLLGYSPASQLQALVGYAVLRNILFAHSGRSVMFIDQAHIEPFALL